MQAFDRRQRANGIALTMQVQFIKQERELFYKGVKAGITPREQLLREARHAAFASAVRTPAGHAIAPAILEVAAHSVQYAFVDSPPLLAAFQEGSASLRPAGRALGVALASLHRTPTYWVPIEPAPRFVWSPAELTPASLTILTTATLTCIKALQASEQLIECLDRLRREEAESAFIHRDATLGNVLASPGGEVALVDWELSGRGDPAVDIATLIGDGLWYWLAEALGKPVKPEGEWIKRTHPLLASFRLMAQAFMSGYRSVGNLDADKVGRFVGLYLLTRVLAGTESRATFSVQLRLLAHIGQRLVLEPDHLWRLVG
jgi:hypothetical protein